MAGPPLCNNQYNAKKTFIQTPQAHKEWPLNTGLAITDGIVCFVGAGKMSTVENKNDYFITQAGELR